MKIRSVPQHGTTENSRPHIGMIIAKLQLMSMVIFSHTELKFAFFRNETYSRARMLKGYEFIRILLYTLCFTLRAFGYGRLYFTSNSKTSKKIEYTLFILFAGVFLLEFELRVEIANQSCGRKSRH